MRSRRKSFRAAAGVAVGLFCVGALADVSHTDTLTPGETTWGSFGYGEGIAVNGDTAVIGAYIGGSAGAYGYGDGKAFVFTHGQSGWSREALTTPTLTSYPANFGWQVGVSGACSVGGVELDHAAVVMSLTYNSAGGVWVYSKPASTGTWSGPTALPDTGYPQSVAISGTTILVGDYAQAHVYEPDATSGWASPQETATLTGPAGSSGNFGTGVDIDGDTAVVGDPYADDGYGCVYVFKRSGGSWTNTATLTNLSTYQYGYFAYKVKVSGDHVIAVAANEPVNDVYGVTTIFDLASDGTWGGDAHVLDVSGMASRYVNNGVAIDGNLAAVVGYGEWRFFARQSDGSWTPEHDELIDWQNQEHRAWGAHPGGVAIDGTTVIVGDPLAGTPSQSLFDNGDGEAYVLGGLPNEAVDTTPPTLSLPANIVAEATSASGRTVSFTVTASDDVDGAITPSVSPASGGTFPLGTTTVNCSATDAAGNAATGSFTVTVRDTTGPVIATPANVVGEAMNANGRVVTFSATATDAVSGSRPVTFSRASGSRFPIGVTTVTCTSRDALGNTSTTSFTVTIRDTTAPTLSVRHVPTCLTPPNHQMVRVRPDISMSDAVDGNPTLTLTITSSEADSGLDRRDRAGDIVIRSARDFDLRAEAGRNGHGRTYTLTWTATDDFGNATRIVKTVTVSNPRNDDDEDEHHGRCDRWDDDDDHDDHDGRGDRDDDHDGHR